MLLSRGRSVSTNLLWAPEGALRNVRWDQLDVAVRERLRAEVEAVEASSRPGLVTVAGQPGDDFAPGLLEQHLQAGRAQVVNLPIVVEQAEDLMSPTDPLHV